MMEKRNVAEAGRTPDPELKRADADWDKEAASEFNTSDAGAQDNGSSKPDKRG